MYEKNEYFIIVLKRNERNFTYPLQQDNLKAIINAAIAMSAESLFCCNCDVIWHREEETG
tara:strand:- start:1238 stop:1417 length:180 start_codon:yes stop_codon:yes gene_type:complete